MNSYYFEFLSFELFLALGLSALLLYGVTYSTSRNVQLEDMNKGMNLPLVQKNVILLSILTLLCGVAILAANTYPSIGLPIVDGTIIFDGISLTSKKIVCILTVIVLGISLQYLPSVGLLMFEYAVLILIVVLGLSLLISSYDLIAFYLALELQSLCLYALATIHRTNIFSTEAGLKYFVLGAVSSGLLLFGMTLIYGFSGTTQFGDLARLMSAGEMNHAFSIGVGLFLTGALFKLAAVPFHQWSPDVYEAAPTSVTAFFAIVPKFIMVVVFGRLLGFVFHDLSNIWSLLLIFCSAASMILAAFAALSQRRLKRFFAYSSIGHVGYMLLGFLTGTVEGLQGVLIYLVLYTIMSIFVWTFILSLEKENGTRALYMTDLCGLGVTNPYLAAGFMLSIFSIAGTPPRAGFFSKMFIFFSAIESGYYLLAAIGVITSCIGGFYYLRFIKVVYFEQPKEIASFKSISKFQSLVMSSSTIFTLLFILEPQFIIDLSRLLALSVMAG